MNKDLLIKIIDDLHFNLTEDEINNILSSFSETKEDLNSLLNLKLDNETSFHPHTLYEATLREDIKEESDSKEDLFRNTDHFTMDEIEVPKVV